MVRRLLPLILLPLAGCAFAPPSLPVARPVEVQIPVDRPVYCRAPLLDHPRLPVAALTTGSAPADTVRAYAATVVILKGAVRERDQVIAGCTETAQAASSGVIAPKQP